MKMTRRKKIIWCLFAGILVLLFLLSSTDFIVKEEQTETYLVSIVTGDTTDDYYSNFRRGMDKTVDEYNVDVNFITLYEKGNITEQMGLLKREANDGVKTIVLVPLKQEKYQTILEEMVLTSPLTVMGNIFPGGWAMTGISQGYQEADWILGEVITKENTPNKPVFLFTGGLDYGYNWEVYAGLLDTLSQVGFQAHLYEMNKNGMPNAPSEEYEGFFRWIMETHVYSDSREAIIAVLGVRSLEWAAGIIAGSPTNMASLPTLYGSGSTTKILNQMDRGVIRGLIAANQLDAGYLGIVKATDAIEKRGGQEQIVLESYYAEKENLQRTYFEKILYLIEWSLAASYPFEQTVEV